jgi:hypothetical protein
MSRRIGSNAFRLVVRFSGVARSGSLTRLHKRLSMRSHTEILKDRLGLSFGDRCSGWS